MHSELKRFHDQKTPDFDQKKGTLHYPGSKEYDRYLKYLEWEESYLYKLKKGLMVILCWWKV